MAEAASDSGDRYSKVIDQRTITSGYVVGYLDSKPLVDGRVQRLYLTATN